MNYLNTVAENIEQTKKKKQNKSAAHYGKEHDLDICLERLIFFLLWEFLFLSFFCYMRYHGLDTSVFSVTFPQLLRVEALPSIQ